MGIVQRIRLDTNIDGVASSSSAPFSAPASAASKKKPVWYPYTCSKSGRRWWWCDGDDSLGWFYVDDKSSGWEQYSDDTRVPRDCGGGMINAKSSFMKMST